MRKTLILLFIFTGISFSSCITTRKIISDTYKVDEEINFTITKYSEPLTEGYFIREYNEKYVVLSIIMTNKSSEIKEVDFDDFYISDSKENVKTPLWRVQRSIEPIGSENKSVLINSSESKKLGLWFVVPENLEIKFLHFNMIKIELNFENPK